MAQELERTPLAGGGEVFVRPVEPHDREGLRDAFERLGKRSRYQRFLVPKRSLTAGELSYLTDVDHVDHEAVVAIDAATGQGVGVARYIRDPGRPDVAEAAVTVVDDWQGRGLGKLLLDRLVARAEANGVTRFSANLLVTNDAVRALLDGAGRLRVLRQGEGAMDVEVELPVERTTLHLALRGAAPLARHEASSPAPESLPP
jgi:GNAT superfamily N-acetyltransferase